MRKKKSLAQQWVSERCFSNFGSLQGIATRLDQIAKCSSTLESEADILQMTASTIRNLARDWNSDLSKSMSLNAFTSRNR